MAPNLHDSCNNRFTDVPLQVYSNHGPRMETYTERVKGAAIEEQFMYTDCYDDSANFTPPHAHVTKVHVALVCLACCFLPVSLHFSWLFSM